MNNSHRRRAERTEIIQILAGYGMDADEITEIDELTEGSFNTTL